MDTWNTIAAVSTVNKVLTGTINEKAFMSPHIVYTALTHGVGTSDPAGSSDMAA